jgi:DNA-binding transcriptional MerR regulator
MPSSPTRLEPARKFAERHGVSVKTLDRWVKSGILSPPDKINGRNYHNPDNKPRRDDARAPDVKVHG